MIIIQSATLDGENIRLSILRKKTLPNHGASHNNLQIPGTVAWRLAQTHWVIQFLKGKITDNIRQLGRLMIPQSRGSQNTGLNLDRLVRYSHAKVADVWRLTMIKDLGMEGQYINQERAAKTYTHAVDNTL
jgi:hypothetical protein